MPPLHFQGIHKQILEDKTEELAVEGARDSGKSYVCVTKEVKALKEHPGIHSFLFRYSDKDVETKLIPFFRQMCEHEDFIGEWDSKELCFDFPNRSRAYLFGIRSTSSAQRYSKIRGLSVARVMCDQTEEIPEDVGLEMRASLRQEGFSHQLVYCANPPGHKHWLVDQFPEKNIAKGRRLYQVSLYDNAHNLRPETIRRLELAFPPEHPKHISIILGKRGPNVTGKPIYGNVFQRKLHVRPVLYNPNAPILECFDFGKLNPCWIAGQRGYAGGMQWLGGILSDELFLTDFLPIVMERRAEWFPDDATFKSCCTLSVSKSVGRLTIGVQELKGYSIRPKWTEGGNSPDIVIAMIERQAAYMRQRGADGMEMLAVNDEEEKWLKVSREGIDPSPFMSEAYMGGYTWAQKADDTTKTISVGSNEFRQPHNDDWFEYPMRAAEHIELNFGAGATQQKRDADARAAKPKSYTPTTAWS